MRKPLPCSSRSIHYCRDRISAKAKAWANQLPGHTTMKSVGQTVRPEPSLILRQRLTSTIRKKDKRIAGRPIIRLGNVLHATLTVYPPKDHNSDYSNSCLSRRRIPHSRHRS